MIYYAYTREQGRFIQVKTTVTTPGQKGVEERTGITYRTVTEAARDSARLNGVREG